MALKVGAADVADVKLGATQVAKVMLGTEQVWPTGPPPPLFQATYTWSTPQSNGALSNEGDAGYIPGELVVHEKSLEGIDRSHFVTAGNTNPHVVVQQAGHADLTGTITHIGDKYQRAHAYVTWTTVDPSGLTVGQTVTVIVPNP